MALSDDDLVNLLHDAADAVTAVLDDLEDWGLAGTRPGQYLSDLAADEAVTAVLLRGGVGVLSEESGVHQPDRDVVVVVDPLDGSTNASRGIGWYAISLCAVDPDGARAALVVDLPRRHRFEAVRGGGARQDGAPIGPSACRRLDEALVALSGYPSRPMGWKQFRAFGAVALDLCQVASGALDAYVDCIPSAHGPWDYLGGMLVCQEAGALVEDASGRDLVVVGHDVRRTPVAAATPELLKQVLEARP